MTGYSKRQNLFQKTEWTWTVEDAGLRERDQKGVERVYPWTDVTKVRIAYAPTRYKTWRHLLELTYRNQSKVTIDNAHFAGVANFENRSASYSPFVRAVIAKLVEAAPGARCSLGAAPVGYWLSMAFVAVVFFVLALLLLAIPIDGIPGVAWAKLGIIVVFIPTLVMWAIKARPRGAKLTDIPDSALPRVA